MSNNQTTLDALTWSLTKAITEALRDAQATTQAATAAKAEPKAKAPTKAQAAAKAKAEAAEAKAILEAFETLFAASEPQRDRNGQVQVTRSGKTKYFVSSPDGEYWAMILHGK